MRADQGPGETGICSKKKMKGLTWEGREGHGWVMLKKFVPVQLNLLTCQVTWRRSAVLG